MTFLSVAENSISDILPLTVLIPAQLRGLWIQDNPLNADAFVHISAMREKGISVRIS